MTWILQKCQVLNALFERIVADEAMITVLNKELFWKNIDTCLILLQALKSQFNALKLDKAYDIMVNTVPILTKDGLEVLETVFFDTSEEESSEEEKELQMENSLRKALTIKLQSVYQEAWLLILAKVP